MTIHSRGVFVDLQDARTLVQVLDVFTAQAKANGATVHPGVQQVHRSLERAVSGVLASVSGGRTGAGERSGTMPVLTGDDQVYGISSAQAAALLGISSAGVRDLVRRGRIPGRRVGGRWVYSGPAVERIAAERAHRVEKRRRTA